MYLISRRAWRTWIDASSGMVRSTKYVLLRTISMLYQMKRVGRLMRTRSWSLQMWLALLRSKSIYPDSQLTGWSSVRSIHLAGPTIHPAGAAEHDPARSPMACSDWIISQEKFKSLNRGHGWCWYEVDRGFSCVDIPVLVSLLLWFGFRWDGGYRASHSAGHHILPDMNRQNGDWTELNWASKQTKKEKWHNSIRKTWQVSPATCLHSFLKDFRTSEHEHLRQTESEEQPRLLLDTVDEQRHWCPMVLLGGKKTLVLVMIWQLSNHDSRQYRGRTMHEDDLSIHCIADMGSAGLSISLALDFFWILIYFIILSHGNYRKRPTIKCWKCTTLFNNIDH